MLVVVTVDPGHGCFVVHSTVFLTVGDWNTKELVIIMSATCGEIHRTRPYISNVAKQSILTADRIKFWRRRVRAQARATTRKPAKMELVGLNEQLREEFAGVVKHFLTIRREEITRVAAATSGGVVFAAAAVVPIPQATATSEKQPLEPDAEKEPTEATAPSVPAGVPRAPLAPGSLLPEQTQRYAALAKTILRRVNTYQYKSREHFGRDIAELLVLAETKDQKVLLQQLVDQQQALGAPSAKATGRAKRQKINGIRIDSAAIPGIQSQPPRWACNIDMRGNTSTMSYRASEEIALETGYKEDVREALRKLPEGMKELDAMAEELGTAVTKFDRAILRDAMKQVRQRLPIGKHHDVSSLVAALTPHPVPQPVSNQSQSQSQSQGQSHSQSTHAATITTVAKEKPVKPSRKPDLNVDTTVPASASTSANGKPITPAAATPELVSKRTPTDSGSRVRFLRLRRIIQIRLCRHLEGREVCTRMNEPDQEESWAATGRLERGKVYLYSTKKHVSFSDYVLATLKRSIAACEHIYLLDTRENIDSHLLVCDQFSDEFRQRLDQSTYFKEVSEQYKQGKLN